MGQIKNRLDDFVCRDKIRQNATEVTVTDLQATKKERIVCLKLWQLMLEVLP